ncbi:hypothetical protein KUH03_36035 [Sphingobacterium sp. E70]|uniref:hypothetical protein n=1 Tax=Sphingobacterium sp. E70 TaxID=2853439 RepID=UPI00211BEC48|nr:hypothetical protein [Sphingobacterium sp. E70]ULT24365.1 hypothetical protein KUH03_36035 [Sphingobacterium sp. E70]
MNTFIKKLKYTPLLAMLLVSGCTKNFEEINTDPDALKDVPPQNMLVNVLRNAGEQFGGDVDGYGTFAGYIVKIQYPDNLSGLIPTDNTYGNRWAACYYNITQMNDLLKKTDDKAAGFKTFGLSHGYGTIICGLICWMAGVIFPIRRLLKEDPKMVRF